MEIHNGGQNARFGSSLAPVPDLNGDGFNDLVVGAPLEDDHKGAIYVFFSQQNRILRKYKQVRAVQRVHYNYNVYVFIGFLLLSSCVDISTNLFAKAYHIFSISTCNISDKKRQNTCVKN